MAKKSTLSSRSEAPLSPEAPDAVRRRDQPEAGMPTSMPRPDEDVRLGGVSPSEDGGVKQHPIHDDDPEDLGPEDYEELMDEVATTGLKSDR
jgi:hypothetical protein